MVNVRSSLSARKRQTTRTRPPRSVTPNVPAGPPGSSSVDAPGTSGRRGSPGAPRPRRLEVDDRGLPLRLLCHLVELPHGEPERSREDDAREGLKSVVEAHHRVVVDLARDRDAILRLLELALELPEVLVPLRLGVGLGDGE